MSEELATSIPEKEEVQQEQTQATPEEEVQVSAKPEEQEEPVSEKPKTQKRFHQLLEERDRYRKEAEQAKEELSKLKNPTLDEFDHDIEQFTDAKVGYVQQATNAKHTITQYEAASKKADEAILETWNGIREQAVKAYPDFKEVFTPDVPISKEMAEALISSDSPAEVAYFLGKNKEEALRIAMLPPHMQGYEMAKIEAKAKPKPKISEAPTPPQNKLSGTGVSKRSYDEMSVEEFMEVRAKERAAREASRHY